MQCLLIWGADKKNCDDPFIFFSLFSNIIKVQILWKPNLIHDKRGLTIPILQGL